MRLLLFFILVGVSAVHAMEDEICHEKVQQIKNSAYRIFKDVYVQHYQQERDVFMSTNSMDVCKESEEKFKQETAILCGWFKQIFQTECCDKMKLPLAQLKQFYAKKCDEHARSDDISDHHYDFEMYGNMYALNELLAYPNLDDHPILSVFRDIELRHNAQRNVMWQ